MSTAGKPKAPVREKGGAIRQVRNGGGYSRRPCLSRRDLWYESSVVRNEYSALHKQKLEEQIARCDQTLVPECQRHESGRRAETSRHRRGEIRHARKTRLLGCHPAHEQAHPRRRE